MSFASPVLGHRETGGGREELGLLVAPLLVHGLPQVVGLPGREGVGFCLLLLFLPLSVFLLRRVLPLRVVLLREVGLVLFRLLLFLLLVLVLVLPAEEREGFVEGLHGPVDGEGGLREEVPLERLGGCVDLRLPLPDFGGGVLRGVVLSRLEEGGDAAGLLPVLPLGAHQLGQGGGSRVIGQARDPLGG